MIGPTRHIKYRMEPLTKVNAACFASLSEGLSTVLGCTPPGTST